MFGSAVVYLRLGADRHRLSADHAHRVVVLAVLASGVVHAVHFYTSYEEISVSEGLDLAHC